MELSQSCLFACKAQPEEVDRISRVVLSGLDWLAMLKAVIFSEELDAIVGAISNLDYTIMILMIRVHGSDVQRRPGEVSNTIPYCLTNSPLGRTMQCKGA